MRPVPTRLGMRCSGLASAILLAVAALPAVAGPAAAVVVPVRLPIVGTRDTQVEAAVVKALDRLRGDAGRRGALVLRFDAGAGSPA
jgi:hypothetical protein